MFKTATGCPCDVEPASPVIAKRIPDWMRQRLLKVFGPTNLGYTDGDYLFEYWSRKYRELPWLDHWGSTVVGDQEIVVSEPYLSMTCDFSEPRRFAELLGCDLTVDAQSYWYPGKTIRLRSSRRMGETFDELSDTVKKVDLAEIRSFVRSLGSRTRRWRPLLTRCVRSGSAAYFNFDQTSLDRRLATKN
jgi:hypothetical protein